MKRIRNVKTRFDTNYRKVYPEGTIPPQEPAHKYHEGTIGAKTMAFAEMQNHVVKRTGVSLRTVRKVLRCYHEIFLRSICFATKIRIEKIGVFEIIRMAGRRHKNNKTGKIERIPALVRLRYSPSTTVRRELKKLDPLMYRTSEHANYEVFK